MKLAGMLRCAAVYQVTSERAHKDSEPQRAAARHFLQYYVIMLALAENKPDDRLDVKTLKTLFEAERAIANSDAVLARAEGKSDVFATDISTCAGFREQQPELFASADRTIETIAKGKAGTP